MLINDFSCSLQRCKLSLQKWITSRKVHTPPFPPSFLSNLQLSNENNTQKKFSIKLLEKEIKIATATRKVVGRIDCGTKVQKLEELSCLFNGNLHVEIPSFRGIPSTTILSFLKEKAPTVFVEWEKLKKMDLNTTTFQKSLSVELILERIAFSIKQAFSSGEFFFDKNWLDEQARKGNFLIVRSTGCEDGSFANAGANESIVYVPPENVPLCEAIGKVVASYFSKKSLQMRLNTGINPFFEKMQLAVLIQELIGEPLSEMHSENEIPVSFVLFTNTASSWSTDFRVMQIALTYGHGEGVVNQQKNGTDFVQVLVSQSKPDRLYTLYEIGKKKERKAPLLETGKVVLTDKLNPKGFLNKRAINTDEISHLFAFSLFIENLIGAASDIEGIIKNGKIYFVQARVLHQKETLPSYLIRKGKKVIPAKTIVGRASVMTVTNEDAILARRTLELAQRDFDASKHTVVLVKDSETSKNSHAIVNFKGLGIPCLQIEQDLKIEVPLVIDMQTETLHFWDKETSIQDAVVSGFGAYPAPIPQINIPDHLQLRKEVLKEITQLLHELRLHESSEEALVILDKLERDPNVQHLALRIQEIDKQTEGMKGISPYLDLLKELEQEIKGLFEETKAVLKQGERIQSLFYIKALETYLVGDGYSLSHVKSTFETISILIDYQKNLSHPSQCEDMLFDGNDYWRNSLLKLENSLLEKTISREELLQFKEMIGTLRELGALPFWMMFLQKQLPPIARFKQQLPDKELIQELLKASQEIQKLDDPINFFSDPRNFLEGFSSLRKIQTCVSLEKLKQCSPIAKVIGYQVLISLVTLFDDTAKAVKSNPDSKDRIKRFKEILILYCHLMENLAKTLVPEYFNSWKIDSEYFKVISRTLNTLPTDNVSQLWPSRDFSVSGAMLGSRSWLERHMPKHLEDILTLIHQNCLVSLSTFQQSILSDEIMDSSFVPQEIKSVIEEMEQQFGTNNWTLLKTGLQVTSDTIIFRYNIPLNAHSGALELHYNNFSKELILKGRFLGESRTRWKEISTWFSILDKVSALPMSVPINQTKQEITFSWKINEENQREAIAEYKAAAIHSLRQAENITEYLTHRVEFWGASKGVIQRIDHNLENIQHPYLTSFRKATSYYPPKNFEDHLYVLKQILIDPSKERLLHFAEKQWTRLAIQHVMHKEDRVMQETLLDLFHAIIEEKKKDSSFDHYKHLYLEEKFPFHIPEPETVCVLAAMQATSIGLGSSHYVVRKKSKSLFKQLLAKEYILQSDYKWMLLGAHLKAFKDLFK